MPLNLNLDSTGVVRIVCTAGRLCRLPGLCMPLLLAACSFPTLPDSRPTVQEVPILGQQMTQEQISTRRAEVAASRATLRQELAQDKAACYARFLVNRCLRQHQDAFTQRDHVYQLQDIELNRQERALKDIDTQLRLQHKAAQAAAQAASSSTAP